MSQEDWSTSHLPSDTNWAYAGCQLSCFIHTPTRGFSTDAAADPDLGLGRVGGADLLSDGTCSSHTVISSAEKTEIWDL